MTTTMKEIMLIFWVGSLLAIGSTITLYFTRKPVASFQESMLRWILYRMSILGMLILGTLALFFVLTYAFTIIIPSVVITYYAYVIALLCSACYIWNIYDAFFYKLRIITGSRQIHITHSMIGMLSGTVGIANLSLFYEVMYSAINDITPLQGNPLALVLLIVVIASVFAVTLLMARIAVIKRKRFWGE